MKKVILCTFSLFLLLVINGVAYAAAPPVIFFSDMTDGPTTGFDGSSTKGAAISIWGVNLGGSIGSSTLTVGGVTLSSANDFAEWGATTNPTTARRLQRITFYLNSSMTTLGATTINVTVGGVSSNAIPFYTRAIGSNHIYFISPTGNDAANGISTATPWRTGKKLRATLVAGDIAYLRAGVYTDVDDNYSAGRKAWIDIHGANINAGTVNKSIGVIAYPGELAQIGDGELYSASNVVPERMIERLLSGSTGVAFNYWTFSKLQTRLAEGNIAEGTSSPNFTDDNLRFVGMDIRTTSAYSGTGIPFTKEGGGGSTNFYLLGNYFHQTGVPNAPASAPALSTGIGTGLTGAYNAKYSYATYAGANLWQESEMSAVAVTPVTLSNGALHITWSQPPASRQADSGRAFTHVRIYRTKAGGSTYYYDQDVAIANTYVDSTTADTSLSTRTTVQGGYYVGAMYFGGYGFLDGVYVMYNEMDTLNGTAIQNYGHVITDYMDHLYFANNYIHNSGTCAWNARPAAILGGGDGGSFYQYARNIYVYNNIFSNNYGSAMRIDSNSWGGGGTFYVQNNTIYYDTIFGPLAQYTLQIAGGPITNVQFQNNIVFSPGIINYNAPYYGNPINSVQGLSEDHNLFFGGGANHGLSVGDEAHPWTGTAVGDMYNTDPQFLVSNPSSILDVQLKATSPAINTGANTGPIVVKDIFGLSRPVDSIYDMGANEYSTGGYIKRTMPPVLKSVQ